MNPQTLLDAVCYGAAFLGGLALFIAPFTSRGRVAPHWMRVALWLCGPIVVAWSTLGFTLHFGAATLSEHACFVVPHTKSLFAGMAVGILMLLFASGEFISAFSRSKSNSDQ